MIEAFSIATAHLFWDALASQARLRHEVFVCRRKLDHFSFAGLEFDELDTPAAIYLIWRERCEAWFGFCARHSPTCSRATGRISSRMEISRIAGCLRGQARVRRQSGLAGDTQNHTPGTSLCGELLSLGGAAGMTAATREHLLSHFIKSGIRWLGPTHEIEGELERAFFVLTPFIRPTANCQEFDIGPRVLLLGPDAISRKDVA
ncbi:hypothetical protein [Bradyrhizobium iriomotense]|nr:hypothetical protein [Bradyrhizobium iriomotense]